jgi:hypothetical protein
MSRSGNDSELRATLRRLRDQDARSAPAFEQILTRRARFAPTRFARRAPLAIAAAILVAVGAYVIAPSHRLTLPSEVVALSAWRPASDVLLDTPAKRILTHVPQLGASLIDFTLGGIPR